MQILQINATANNTGGASRVVMDISKGLTKKGYVSTLFSGTNNQTTHLPVHKIRKTRLQSLISHALADDSSYFATDYLLEEPLFKSADLVHAHNVHGWYFNLATLEKMSAQKPLVWTLHDMWAITPHCAHSYGDTCTDGFFTCRSRSDYPSIWWPNEKSLRANKREVYKNLNVHLVTPSLWLREKVGRSVLQDKPISVIHNGVDTSVFTPLPQAEARQALGLPLDKKIILFVANGGLANQFKGGEYVRAVAEHYRTDSSVLVLCVGGERDETHGNLLEKKSTADTALLQKYYSAADVLLFPSLAENFPLVILEALACGLPIVAFSVGGVPEAIEHDSTGYISKYKDMEDLLQQLDNIMSASHPTLTTMRTLCRQSAVEKFSVNRMVEEYVALYKKLV